MTTSTELVTIRGGVLTTTDTDRLQELKVKWLLQYRNANTLGAYRRDIDHFITWADNRGVDPLHLSREHLNAYANGLSADSAPSTVARRLTVVSSFYEFAIDMGLLQVNPAARVKRPACGPDHVKLTGALTHTESAALYAAATSAQDRALVVLLATTGLRVSEALQLTTTSMTTERGHTVVSVVGKGNKTTLVPLAPLVIDALTELAGIRGHGPLFIGHTGEALTRHGVARTLTRLAHRAGLGKPVSPHMMRAGAITNALVDGVPLHQVQAMARHSDPKTTMRYFRAADSLNTHPAYRLSEGLTSALSADTAARV